MTIFMHSFKWNHKSTEEIYFRRIFKKWSNLESNFENFKIDLKWHIQGLCDITWHLKAIFDKKRHNQACVTSPSSGNQVDGLPGGVSWSSAAASDNRYNWHEIWYFWWNLWCNVNLNFDFSFSMHINDYFHA